MPRTDLLALTEDDLVALTNRGTVKRAQRELEENAAACEIEESPAGDLKFTWSDGAECEIPAGASLKEARCSSGSAGISRHLVRSVLLYKRRQTPAESPAPAEAWDPGTVFSDEMLEQQYRKADISRARARFETGVLVELVRSPKPLARFLDEPCVLRFMVRGDLRYIHADCSQQAQGLFVPLAVWAFRQLPPDKESGLVSIQTKPLPVPTELLGDLEKLLSECAVSGLAAVGDVWKQRLLRLQDRCRGEGLIWPAEIVAELVEEFDRYQQHDARFSLERAVDLIGELLIRADAIRAGRPEIPQILVRGTGDDRVSDIDSARLIGLGCGVQAGRKTTTITAYLQDINTGTVAGLMRDFANSDDASATPRDFGLLAQTPVVRGVSLAAIGGGQLLLKSAKRTPSQRLILPRTGVGVNPQAFAWEKLRPPLLCESIAELTALLAALPPPSLRSRRVTEDLFVIVVDQVEGARFDVATQSVIATLVDGVGGRATLLHPYTNRSAAGTQSLIEWLSRDKAKLRFVAGHARSSTAGLVVHPINAVFELEQGRTAVQPWIDSRAASTPSNSLPDAPASELLPPLAAALQPWHAAIGELWLIGTRRVTQPLIAQWQESHQRLERTGLHRLAETTGRLTNQLSSRLANPQYTGELAATQLLYASVLARLAAEQQ